MIKTRNKRIKSFVKQRLDYSKIDETTTELLISDISSFVRNELEAEDKMMEDGIKVIFNTTIESSMGEIMLIDQLSRIQQIAIQILTERGCPPVTKNKD